MPERFRDMEVERQLERTGGVSSATSDSITRFPRDEPTPLFNHPAYHPQADSSTPHSELFGNHVRACAVVDSVAHHSRSLGVVSSVASSSNFDPRYSSVRYAPYQPQDGLNQQVDTAFSVLDNEAKNCFTSLVDACCRA